MAKLLRKWSQARNWRLTSTNLTEIWNATLASIWYSAREGKFKHHGTLDGFINTIAYRRAIDLMRARDKDWRELPGRDFLLLAIPAKDERYETTRDRFARFLEYIYWEKLSATERLVINHLIDFVTEENAYPSLAELTQYINQNRTLDDQLSEAAVKSAKQRAFGKLRDKENRRND